MQEQSVLQVAQIQQNQVEVVEPLSQTLQTAIVDHQVIQVVQIVQVQSHRIVELAQTIQLNHHTHIITTFQSQKQFIMMQLRIKKLKLFKRLMMNLYIKHNIFVIDVVIIHLIQML